VRYKSIKILLPWNYSWDFL